MDPDLPAVQCHVKSVSRAGASIVVREGDFVPDQFELVIRKTNERHHVILAWSCGTRLGRAFRPGSADAKKWASPSGLRKTASISRAYGG
jgi:hypothetical protein